jgi:succinate dehydrogenase / fumarate reductase membrane anchor subunit
MMRCAQRSLIPPWRWQVIIEDYVHAEGIKLVCLLLNTFFTAAVGIASIFALLKLAFGG